MELQTDKGKQVATQTALPKTPPRPAGQAPIKVQTTPQDPGAGGRPPRAPGDANVLPMVQRILPDIHFQRHIPADDFLNYLLTLCAENDKQLPSDLLKKCIDKVLPIANDKGEFFEHIGGATTVVELMSEYVQAPDEKARYKPFFTLMNCCFARLASVKVKGIRSASDERLIVQTVGGTELQQTHGFKIKAYRSPDGVLVFLSDAECSVRLPQAGDGEKKETDYFTNKDRVENRNATKNLSIDERFVKHASKRASEKIIRHCESPWLSWRAVISSLDLKVCRKIKDDSDILQTARKHKYKYNPPSDPKYVVVHGIIPTEQKGPQLESEDVVMQNIEEKPPAPSKTSSKRGKGSAARGSKSDTQPTRRSERIQASHDKAPKKTSETASAGEKRSLQDMTESETRKRSFPSIESGQEEKPAGREKPSVQSAVYASESLATGMMDFVINIMIADEFVTVWYYDRQSPIQCSGIDFLKDFPRFLVLLFALQRLRPEQLGRNPWFSSQNICIPGEEDYKCHYYVKTSSDDSTALKITLDERHFSPIGILGRGTAVYNVRERHGFVSPSEKEKEEKLVLKASWPERSRVSENDMLDAIYSIIEALDVQDKQFVEGHVPRYLWASDISVHDTSKIRQKLGLLEIDPNTDHDGSRINRLLLFKQLSKSDQIFRREGGDKKNIDERFIKIWWDCLICHFILWIKGVHHCDVSDGNLMYYTVDNGVHMGVLNDFDLATIDRDGTASRPTGNLRTGTQPFMAMDLLEDDGQNGHIPHLYRHDLESFIWLLVWYSKPMIDGKPLDIKSWETGTAEYCYDKKNSFWTNYTKYTSDIQEKLFFVTCNLIYAMKKKVFTPMADAKEYAFVARLRSPEQLPPSFSEPSPYELFEAFQTIVLGFAQNFMSISTPK